MSKHSDSNNNASPSISSTLLYRSRAKTSKVWQFINEANDKQSGTCKLCNEVIVSSRNTTNYHQHLIRHHQTIYEPEETITVDENADHEENNNENLNSEMQTTPTRKRKRGQMAITEYYKSSREQETYGPTSKKKKRLDQCVARFVIRDLQPFSVVEDDGFRELLKELDPRYRLPSRRTLRDSYIVTAYHKTVSHLSEILQIAENIAITFDGWTSRANQSFLTMTAHFINRDATLEAVTLAVTPIPGRSTVEQLQPLLESNLQKFQCMQLLCGVTDNGANMVAACNALNLRNMRCAAHTIQLVVNTAICKTNRKTAISENGEDIMELFKGDENQDDDGIFLESNVFSILKKCKRITSFFHKSGPASLELKKELKMRNIPDKKLVQSVYTRWNSSLAMLESIHLACDAITVVLSKSNKSKVPLLSPIEIAALPQIIEILKPFANISTELGGGTYPTMSLVIPCTKLLKETLEKRFDLLPIVEELKEHLLTQLQKRLLPYEERTISSVATVLDPRFKQHGFVNRGNYTNAASVIKSEMKKDVENKIADARGRNIAFDQLSDKPSPTGRFTFLDKVRTQAPTQPTIPGTSQVIVHLNAYLEEEILPENADILKYWRDYTACDSLKKVALKYLTPPATSVSSERVNSTAGNTITEKRASLDAKMAEMLVFLRQNYKYLQMIAEN